MFPSPNIFHQTPALSPTHSELGWEPQWIVVALSLFSVAPSVWLRPSGAPAPLRFVWDSRPLRLVGRRGAPVASHLPPGPTLQSPRPCLFPAGAARAWTVTATSSPRPHASRPVRRSHLRLPGVQAAAAAGGGSATPGSRAAAPHGGESRAGRQRWGRPRAETPATRLRNPRAASRAQRSAQACRGARRGPRGQREAPCCWTPLAPQVCVLGLSTCRRCRGGRAPGPFPDLPKSPSVLRVKRRGVLWSSGKTF